MERRNAFSDCHPLVNFLYFALVLLFTMFFLHPVCLAVSLTSALLCAADLYGWRRVGRQLRYLLPMALLAAVLNPAFNHEGATILTYLPSGNPLTLESILYGLAASAMLAAAVVWFTCASAVLTSDKMVWLFGRLLPALSLLLSMTLRSVPRFQARFRTVREARRCVGRDGSGGSWFRRLKNTAAQVSILVTWSLESAVETADSMRGRGWGLPGRTSFSIYRLEGRDRTLLVWLAFCGVFIAAGWAAGGLDWRYYPTVRGTLTGVLPVGFQLVYLALCLTPVIFNRREARQWTRSRSAT